MATLPRDTCFNGLQYLRKCQGLSTRRGGGLYPFSREKAVQKALMALGTHIACFLQMKERDKLASCLSTHGHHLVLCHLFFFFYSFSSHHASGARMAEEADRLLCATFTYHLS